jgi:hypothetical protein
MSLHFGAASSFIQFGIGGAANAGNGAVTMIALWAPNFGLGVNSGVVSALSSTTERRSFLMDTSALFGDGDFTSGVAISGTLGDFLWIAMSKAAGATTYRMHWKNLTTGGAWTHAVAAGAANHSDPGTSDNLKVGANPSTSASTGDVAVSAIKLANMADLAIEAACTSALSDLIAAAPDWAVRMMNSAPTSLQDLIGSGHETTRSGTITNTADPSGFNFTLGAAAVLIGQSSTNRHPGRGPGTARFQQTPRSTEIAAAVVNLSDSVEAATASATSTVTGSVRVLSSSVEAAHAFTSSTRAVSAANRLSSVEAAFAGGFSTVAQRSIALSQAVEAAHASVASTVARSARSLQHNVEGAHALGVGSSSKSARSMSSSVESGSALGVSTRAVSQIDLFNSVTDSAEAGFAFAGMSVVRSRRDIAQVARAVVGAWSTHARSLRDVVWSVDGNSASVGSMLVRSSVNAPVGTIVEPGFAWASEMSVTSLISFGIPDLTIDLSLRGTIALDGLIGAVDITTRQGSVEI